MFLGGDRKIPGKDYAFRMLRSSAYNASAVEFQSRGELSVGRS